MNRSEARSVAFAFSTLLVSWPFLSMSRETAPRSIFFHVFGIWGLIIFILFIFSQIRSKAPLPPTDQGHTTKEPTNND